MNTKEISKHIATIADTIDFVSQNTDGDEMQSAKMLPNLYATYDYLLKIRNKQLHNSVMRVLKKKRKV